MSSSGVRQILMSFVIHCVKMAQVIVGQSSTFSSDRETDHVFIFSAAQKAFLRNVWFMHHHSPPIFPSSIAHVSS